MSRAISYSATAQRGNELRAMRRRYLATIEGAAAGPSVLAVMLAASTFFLTLTS